MKGTLPSETGRKPKAVFLNDNPAKVDEVFPPSVREKLHREVELLPQTVTHDQLEAHREQLADVEYIFSTWGMPHCAQEEIRTFFPAAKALFYAAGSVHGFAREFLDCGVRVFSAWGANAVPVAEYTVAQIILANKGFYLSARRFRSRAGHDEACRHVSGFPGNYGIRVGILGCGMIGSLVAEMLKTYNLDVLAFDPFLNDKRAEELGVTKCALDRVFEECQTISNHLANNERTEKMLHYGLFSRMKPNATFINTGRGAQVVEEDLAKALKEQPRRTAVLDVTYPEPPMEDSPLYALENVFLTPHIAGSAGHEVARMGEYMADEFIAMKKGAPLRYEVTLQMLDTMA